MTNTEIFKKVESLIFKNIEKGGGNGKPHYQFAKPSPDTYPYQFFWDTCFHSLIFCALGKSDVAKKHIRSLFSMQREDGFVGHMIYWHRLKPGRWTDLFQSLPRFKNLYKSHMSALIQPPIAAHAVEQIYKSSKDIEFVKEMLPKLKKHFTWLAKNRTVNGEKILTIISPFESGMDWKATYDEPAGFKPGKANWKLFVKVVLIDLRNFLNNYNYKKIHEKAYFLVKDVGLNTIYAENLLIMANLCEALDDPAAKEYRKLADEVTQEIVEIMYNKEDKAFYDCYGKDNKQIKILTPTIFFPTVLKKVPDEIRKEVLQAHFFNSDEFDTRYPLPSLAKSEAAFDPTETIYIWRGPTWILNNWFLHKFLLGTGRTEEAKKMVLSIQELIDKSGFREYYHPTTGEGYGAKDFTWAGLITDMIITQEQYHQSLDSKGNTIV